MCVRVLFAEFAFSATTCTGLPQAGSARVVVSPRFISAAYGSTVFLLPTVSISAAVPRLID